MPILTQGAALDASGGGGVREYGEVHRGQWLDFSTEFRNAPAQAARIVRIKKGCSRCTDLKVSKSVLQPGEAATLSTRFQVGDRPERETRHYYVFTDSSPTSPALTITLTWKVAAYIKHWPERIAFEDKPHDEALETRVLIQVGGLGQDVRVTSACKGSSGICDRAGKDSSHQNPRDRGGKQRQVTESLGRQKPSIVGRYLTPSSIPIGDRRGRRVWGKPDFQRERGGVAAVRRNSQNLAVAFVIEP